jgi:DNA mismatch repair protein MutL
MGSAFLSIGPFSNVGSQEKLKPLPFSSIRSQEGLASSPSQKLKKALPILRILGQVQGSYIVAEGPEGMYLIDQHAAHERVLFERLSEQQAQRKVEVQGLLEPVAVELTMCQQELLKSRHEALAECGFAIEPFGERSYLIRTVPALLQGQDVAQSLIGLLDSLAEGAAGEWQERIAISLACHGAVRAGQVLSQQEMEELIHQLEQTKFPRTCPHGRPTMVQLNISQLEREFGRR